MSRAATRPRSSKPSSWRGVDAIALIAACGVLFSAPARAAADAADDANTNWRVEGQLTNVTQRHPAIRSPYAGANSLQARERTEETTDLTAFVGRRLGASTELWVNAEIDQGFGLSNTLGVAGFPSGEAYKVGANRPYLRLPRAFVRHTVSLGGEAEPVEAATNQFAGTRSSENVVITVGKFSAVDVFDTNTYAHDPRADFLNWSVVDAGAFDYAADAWGYTFGAAAEWTRGAWTWRGGVFQMSRVPNGKVAGLHLDQQMWVAEAEHRHTWGERAGKVKLLVFVDRARMGRYRDALALSASTGDAPDTGDVRRFQAKAGVALNVEQELARDVGVFARASANDGRKEAYEFTEINRSVSAGVSFKGRAWGRADDTLGVAGAVNGLSRAARDYFAAGGMGILIGDGRLNYGPERIAEAYYAASLTWQIAVSLDAQRIVHPAYNRDRGPVNVYGVRLHAQF